MAAPTDPALARLLDAVAKAAPKTLNGLPVAPAAFIRTYYEHVPPQDLTRVAPRDLAAAALAHLSFGAARPRGRALVRVYNPDAKRDGWTSERTVVDVVNDDMPFLVDSVTAAINRADLVAHLVIHPIFGVRRDKGGRVQEVGTRGAEGTGAESFMRFEITAISAARHADLAKEIEATLADVRAAVEDWLAMRAKMLDVASEFGGPHAGKAASELQALLGWVHDDHFTFLGYRDVAIEAKGEKVRTEAVPGTGLGVLRDPAVAVFRELRDPAAMSPAVREFVLRPEPLLITKSNLRSRVHRPVYMDTIGIKRLDARGRVVGQRLFVGLFTSSAYSRSPRDIPVLRRKIENVVARAGFAANSHDGKALLHILETYPRDELFQVTEDHLLKTGLGILHLQERQRAALFIRRDAFERFMSCLVYIPRDRYTTELRRRIQDILGEAFAGEVGGHYIQLDDSPLARLHIIVQTKAGAIPPYDAAEIERRIAMAARSWADQLADALVTAHGEEKALELGRRYGNAFPAGYQDRFEASQALADIAQIDRALASGELGLRLYTAHDEEGERLRFRIFSPQRAIPLSDVLPMLEHMGLKVIDEIPFRVRPQAADGTKAKVTIHDFGLAPRDGGRLPDVAQVRDEFHDAFGRVWRGEMESDGFNALILAAGFDWREVTVLRAYCKYLRQTGITFSQAYMEQTLLKHAPVVRRLVDLFRATFDPDGAAKAKARLAPLKAEIAALLDKVASADEDRILRRFLNVIECTLRTNFFQADADGRPKPVLSFKLSSREIDELPLPKPLYEISVYSPRLEGIHLRFGAVARGGIRWSDRPEDFRTEILGLVKAQQVKNAVIVPVGAKGGFVLKRPPSAADRDAFFAEGVACYKAFISGLLDITDNIQGKRIVPPLRVVRRDGDDPYLVVAADKGTATFSDIANGISGQYGFWLGDAFASGGNAGYDHKKMAITARGAWESVKRHFREIGRDIQSEDFTVAGVGDMSGDVFGNGMLQSRHIRLIAAFDHRHIFIDPNPDAATSYAERQRLFALPRSSWADYDAKLISKGGGVYPRTVKSVALSAEARAKLGIAKESVTPAELMRAVLRAEVDLLWFGGIGTYVKASHESHADVGDRANDSNHIDGDEIRAPVVGEGANLGVTQHGRIEYALKGGRLNADSIDNSGGVDCSDHEVNIKILFGAAMAADKITLKRRNEVLSRMTDEVAALVLRNNYLQTQAISVVTAQGPEVIDDQARLIRLLEKAGRMSREVERLPDDETLAERAAQKKGLTRPEVAVLMPHAKLWLKDELLASNLPDNPLLEADLIGYFPTPLRKPYTAEILGHRLRREIVATLVTNSMINRVGGTFISRLMEKSGFSPVEIARAYTATRDVFSMRNIWREVESLDNKIPAALQTAMLLEGNRLIERGTLWFLRHAAHPIDMAACHATFHPGVSEISDKFRDVLPVHYDEALRTRAAGYEKQGASPTLALRMAGLLNLISALDIVQLAGRHKRKVLEVARLYYAIGARFQFGRLRAAAERLDAPSHWQQLACDALIEDLFAEQGALTAAILKRGATRSADAAIDKWIASRKSEVDSVDAVSGEILAAEPIDLSMLTVVARRMQVLAHGA